MRKRSLLMLAAVVAIGAAVVLWLRAESPPRSALKAQGEQMIVAIEQYRVEHEEYPPSLADAGIMPPSHGHGPWRYERGNGYFSLAVGDYGNDWFVLSYMSGGRGWYLDD